MASCNKSLSGSRLFLSLSLAFTLVAFGSSNLRSAAFQSSVVEEEADMVDVALSDERVAELQATAQNAYGKLELSFEANMGQTNEAVDFLARGAGYTLFLTPTEAVFVMARRGRQQTLNRKDHLIRESTAQSAAGAGAPEPPAVLRMKLKGAKTESVARGQNQLPGIVNYFIGDDAEKWHTNIPTFERVHYANVYEGVDMVYYGNQRQLEYDFVVKPGTDYKQIALVFEGADKVEVDAATGDLLLRVGEGTLRQQRPVVYQEMNGERKGIESRYELKGAGRVGFAVGAYDAQRPLIIDPVLVYSTYLGGSANDEGNGIAVDSAGNAYVTGESSSANFPTVNPLQASQGTDAFVAKLNAAGSALLYSTYLGGSGSDIGTGIGIDSAGNAYVSGLTSSFNFPTASAIQGIFGGGAVDGFVTKLNAAGSALVYSTYLGGSGNDTAQGIAVDAAGNAYVTGDTLSNNFPTANPLQTNQPGDDAFVTKLNAAGSALVYSTYLGGSNTDIGFDIAADSLGNAYVTGRTESTNFLTVNAFQNIFGGVVDVFVTKINPSGSALYSTYLGGDHDDHGEGIAVDTAGNAYVTGQTYSDDFPTANAFDDVNPESDPTAFVTKLSAIGSSLVYSTYLGTGGLESGYAISVDSARNAYVTGEVTASPNFPVVNAIQNMPGGSTDAFVTKFNAAGSALLYSTFLGGNLNDLGFGIAVDSAGNAYVTGETSSINFPATPGAFQPGPDANRSAFVSKIGSFSITGRVVDTSGNPVAGVTINLSGANSATTTTDAAGNFLFLSTTPGGNFTVTPTREGFTFSPPSVTINDLNTSQELIFVATSGTGTPTPTPTPASGTFQFSAPSFGVSEDVGHFQITVTRSDDTSAAATVDYATTDGTANDRGDYTTAIGRLRFGAGETARSFDLFITDDVYAEGNETINITLSDPSAGSQIGAMMTTLLTIVDNDLVTALANPIDSTTFFVRQHYVDFFNREPDAAGLAFWIANIDSCGANVGCREVKRIDTSAAFFLSIEFQETGFLVERLYRAAFNRFPTYREFLRDTQELGRGVIVGQGSWEAQLAANRQQFIADFVLRSEFVSIYSGFSNEQFVDALNANTVGSLSTAERNALVAGLNGAIETRTTALEKIAEDTDFVTRETNPAFVLAQYFGYLRRNPQDPPDIDLTGFNFWLAKLNSFGGDFRAAELVKAFISSAEYRGRFGPP